jgi:hypothetical protein
VWEETQRATFEGDPKDHQENHRDVCIGSLFLPIWKENNKWENVGYVLYYLHESWHQAW